MCIVLLAGCTQNTYQSPANQPATIEVDAINECFQANENKGAKSSYLVPVKCFNKKVTAYYQGNNYPFPKILEWGNSERIKIATDAEKKKITAEQFQNKFVDIYTQQITKTKIAWEKKIEEAVIKADQEKCTTYGFKKGTDKFADCMQKIAVHRENAVQNQAMLEQQIQSQRQMAALQYLQNWSLQQQAIAAQQNIAAQNQMNMMMMNNIDCTSTPGFGGTVRTRCW